MKKIHIVVRLISGWGYENREHVCAVEDEALANSIIEWLKVNDDDFRNNADVDVSYYTYTEVIVGDMDEFIMHWEGPL